MPDTSIYFHSRFAVNFIIRQEKSDVVSATNDQPAPGFFNTIGKAQLSPESAKVIGEFITSQMRAIEGLDFERRIALLEAKYGEAEASLEESHDDPEIALEARGADPSALRQGRPCRHRGK